MNLSLIKITSLHLWLILILWILLIFSFITHPVSVPDLCIICIISTMCKSIGFAGSRMANTASTTTWWQGNNYLYYTNCGVSQVFPAVRKAVTGQSCIKLQYFLLCDIANQLPFIPLWQIKSATGIVYSK